MAKLQLDPKKMAAVKKLAQGKIAEKLKDPITKGLTTYFGEREKSIKSALGSNASQNPKNVVASMRSKATTAQGKGGQTMGQKATTAQGKTAQVGGQKMGGKEELQMGTYALPDVVNVAGMTFNADQAYDALKKVERTYGIDSDEYKSLSYSIGAEGGKRKYGITYKKPDLRKDAGKSYTDTIQYSFQGSPDRNPAASRFVLAEDQKSLELLNKLGVKGQRTLAKDKEAVQR
jgi:hypothetical protein